MAAVPDPVDRKPLQQALGEASSIVEEAMLLIDHELNGLLGLVEELDGVGAADAYLARRAEELLSGVEVGKVRVP